ncbi:methyltransferase [Candidatus Gastranaerophilus sp. (ex Termes propinquus)]|nr:methyltransferase [Candidatus Gastranaerophilus sp. (ex Termes propinquus)]
MCPLCDSGDTVEIVRELRDRSDLPALKCKSCSLVFLSTFDHISDDFYQNDGMFGKKFDYNIWRRNSEKDDVRRFNFLKKSLKNKVILDFGCGAGGFLKHAQNTAKAAVGLEINKSVLDFLIQDGILAYDSLENLEDKGFGKEFGNEFDIITMFHVLEHVKSPVKTLKDLRQYLKHDGEVLIEVPNADDALLSLYRCAKYRKFAYWSCHLYCFNRKNLVKIAQNAGYKVNYLKRIQRYGLFNHLRWIFKNEPNGHKSTHFLNNSLVDRVYSMFLNMLKANDTLILSISPSPKTLP